MSNQKKRENPVQRPGQLDDAAANFDLARHSAPAALDGGDDKGAVVDTGLAPMPANAKPQRRRATKPTVDAAVELGPKPVSKATRVPKKRLVETAGFADKGVVEGSSSQPTDQSVPPITAEAAAFLGKPDATPGDLLKLRPESLEFVRYHLNFMEKVEATSQANNAYLMANLRPVSPVLQEFVDALVRRAPAKSNLINEQVTAQIVSLDTSKLPRAAAAFYGFKAPLIGALAPIALEFAKLEILSTHRSPRHYKVGFGRQASEKAIKSDRKADSVLPHSRGLENSVEPSLVRMVLASPQIVPSESAAKMPKVTSGLVSRSGAFWRFMDTISGVAQRASGWGADREKATTSAAGSPMGNASHSMDSAMAAALVTEGSDRSNVIPDGVARRFLRVENEYFFLDQSPAFTDRGNKLATRGAHPEVVRSLVEIAKARGWDDITIKGDEEFRRGAWMEASRNGLLVSGYVPTPLDLAELARHPANNILEKGATRMKDSSQSKQTAGRTQAPPVSASLDVQNERDGEYVAADLKPNPDLAAKAKAFEESKPAFVVKKYPDLVGAYGIVEAAKAFAGEKLPEAAREEFIGMARRHVMQRIMTGDPVKGPKVYMGNTRATRDTSKATERKGVAAQGKVQEKEIAKDR